MRIALIFPALVRRNEDVGDEMAKPGRESRSANSNFGLPERNSNLPWLWLGSRKLGRTKSGQGDRPLSTWWQIVRNLVVDILSVMFVFVPGGGLMIFLGMLIENHQKDWWVTKALVIVCAVTLFWLSRKLSRAMKKVIRERLGEKETWGE